MKKPERNRTRNLVLPLMVMVGAVGVWETLVWIFHLRHVACILPFKAGLARKVAGFAAPNKSGAGSANHENALVWWFLNWSCLGRPCRVLGEARGAP